MATSKPHVAILVAPGLGQIIPTLELGKCLVSHYNCRVTFFPFTSSDSQQSPMENQIIQSYMKPGIMDYIRLTVDISGLVPSDASTGLKLCIMNQQVSPILLEAISSLKSKPTVLVTDIFGTATFPIAEELKMSKFVFYFSHAWLVALNLYSPTLDKEVKGEFIDKKDPVKIPGCKSVQPGDLFDPLLDRKDELYQWYLKACNWINKADGIFVNTMEELESTTLAALNKGKLGGVSKPPVYAVGPLIRQPMESERKRSSVFDWLDQQPADSVIYVAFGSGATISAEQITELAFGLEQSGHKFVWVVRPPTTKTGDDLYCSGGRAGNDASGEKQPSSYLPAGFTSRTHSTGFVVTDWVSQWEILKHPSVGGFFFHCGWNSVLESVANGVPMVAWPLFAEQRMTAALLSEELGIALRAEALPPKNLIGRDEVAKAVKKIMDKGDKEGRDMRARVKKLMHSAERALANPIPVPLVSSIF